MDNIEVGLREANKRATRIAIEEAARDLFAAHGYEATSVREIADRAGIGERTFYRYFNGKEGLLSQELDRWIELLQAAIRARPAAQPPLAAVQDAVTDLAGQVGAGRRTAPGWFFTNRPNLPELLQRAALRPLLRFENAITDALLAREPTAGGESSRYQAQLVARVCVAVIRTAAIHRRELVSENPEMAPTIQRVLADAFAELSAATGTGKPRPRDS